MKVVDFKGNQYTWPPNGYTVDNDERRPRSELHLKVRSILKEKYPLDPILEEIPLPSTRLSLDFYLPRRKIGIECQGEQHFKQINHFHKDKLGFIQSLKRDMVKKEWCALNNIDLIEVRFDDTEEIICQKITPNKI